MTIALDVLGRLRSPASPIDVNALPEVLLQRLWVPQTVCCARVATRIVYMLRQAR